MTAVQPDIQKLEALLKSATNERQRKMYLSLLNKARASMASKSTPEEQKTAESSTRKTKTTASTKKAAKKTSKEKELSSSPTSNKTSSKVNATSNKEKASSKDDSIIVTEESSTTNNSTTEIDNEPQVATEKEAERSTSEPKTNPLNVEDKESTSTKKKTQKKSKRKKDSNKATSSPASERTSHDVESSSTSVSSSTERPYFSGVGVIKCTPYIEDEKLFVTIDEQKYKLHKVVGARRKQIELLKSELEQNGSREMLLKVYPNITHNSNGKPPHQIFRLVQFYLDREKYPDFQEGFIFHGIWRVIPYCSSPVITINRNINRLGVYKNLSSVAQKYFAKPQDFPIVWDAPVEPFKYNPELKKSEQMPCYFVRVRATFKDGQYIMTEMLSEPTLKIPRFIKPPKKNRNNKDKFKQTKHSEQNPDLTTKVISEPINQLDKESNSTTEIV